jgi:hypothetical protein
MVTIIMVMVTITTTDLLAFPTTASYPYLVMPIYMARDFPGKYPDRTKSGHVYLQSAGQAPNIFSLYLCVSKLVCWKHLRLPLYRRVFRVSVDSFQRMNHDQLRLGGIGEDRTASVARESGGGPGRERVEWD